MPPPPPRSPSVAAASRAALLGAPDARASGPFPPPSTFPGASPPVPEVTLLYWVKAGAKWSASTADGTPVVTVQTSMGVRDKLDVRAPGGKHSPVWASATHFLSGVGSTLLTGRRGDTVAVLTDGEDEAGAGGRWVVRYSAAAAAAAAVAAETATATGAADWTAPAALTVEPPATAAARRAPSAVVTAAADGRAVVAIGFAADGKRALVRLAPGADLVVAAWLTVCAARWRKEGQSKGGGAALAEAGVELGMMMV